MSMEKIVSTEPRSISDGGRSSGFAVQAEILDRRSVMPAKSRGGKRLRKRLVNNGSGVQREDERKPSVPPELLRVTTSTSRGTL
jgi:hypothetical protein